MTRTKLIMKIEQLNALLPDGCAIVWDRGIDVGDTIFCYGWIEKKHRAETPGIHALPRLYDFLFVELDKANGSVKWWITSSAKWSLKFQVSFGGNPNDHAECIGIDEVLGMIENTD